MLISFEVTNFRSIRATQTLSLVKSKGGELADTNTFVAQSPDKLELLRSTAIYGPNASGKTNLLLAMRTMKAMVLESAVEKKPGDSLPVTPFQLDPDTRTAASSFEVSFIVDEVRYQYGFAATAARIHEEWLFAFPKARAQRWFERVWNPATETYDWELGGHLTGEKLLWRKSTRDNALFLSTAVQLNSQQLQPLYEWFRSKLRVAGVSGWRPSFTAQMYEKEGNTRLLEYLRAADLGIDDIRVERKPFDISRLPDDLSDDLKTRILEKRGNSPTLEISTLHVASNGESVTFDLNDESDGTKKMFAFAGPWLDVLENGYILVIDELHDNLHPKLVQFLVGLFHDSDTNPKNAQLVFTTHETSILTQEVFRRDQIWFCEKDPDQSTRLYPLTDFSPRKGRENLELAYLSGRYGALPFVRTLPKIPETDEPSTRMADDGEA